MIVLVWLCVALQVVVSGLWFGSSYILWLDYRDSPPTSLRRLVGWLNFLGFAVLLWMIPEIPFF